MYSWISSNVIQTIGENINHGINNAVTVLENFDDEFNNHNQEEEEEQEQREIEIYKKLLEDAQMQHVELSKQFRVALSEKDAELMIWKKRCNVDDPNSNEFKETISNAILSAELEALKSTLQDVEERMRTLLREKNEAAIKLSQYPELLDELSKLRSTIEAKTENEAKKADEIDDLVQEYSKLAAESEKQKSTDALRLKELELENEVLSTKLQALEHSITELADRSNSLPVPNSPSRDNLSSQSPQVISETEIKQLRAKVVNLEYDITEKNEKISALEADLRNCKSMTSHGDVSPSNEEVKVLESTLARKIEEINHLQSDISRLQLEKQEAEVSGKSFYEQLRALQKEVELDKRKQADNEMNTQAEMLLKEENRSLVLTLEKKSSEMKEIVDKLQNDNVQLQHQFQSMQTEKEQVIAALTSEKDQLTKDLNTQAQRCQEIQNEINLFQSQLSSSSSEKDKLISELKSTITSLQSEISQIHESHQQEITKVKASLVSQVEEITAESNTSKEAEIHKIHATYDEKITSYIQQIGELQTKLESLQIESSKRTEELEIQHQQTLKSLQESFETKHLTERQQIELSHERELQDLRAQLSIEGKELSDRNVAEALAQAEIRLNTQLNDQKIKLEGEFSIRVDNMILEQQKIKEAALQQLQEKLEDHCNNALSELRNQLTTANEAKIVSLQESHSQAISDLKLEHDKVLKESLEKIRLEHEEITRLERLNHEKEIEKIKVGHLDEVNRLNVTIKDLQQQLSNIETIHAEKLRVALDDLTIQKEKEREAAVQQIKLEMQSLVDAAYTARDEYLALYTKENKQRKALHNKLMDIQGNIRVICRVRPILDVERRSGEGIDATEILSDEDIVIHRDQSTKNRFEFDRVLSPGTPQEIVFEAVQPLIISVLDGYNVCIFAYGQTGSGKTYTMEGYGSDIGVSPRAIDEVFSVINGCSEDWSYTVTFSSLEIYNESIRDLLDSSGTKDKLDVRQTPEGNSVPGLTEVQVTHSAEVLDLMRQSQTNRAVGAHDMNEHSSRSHSILTLTCRGRNLRDGSTTYGKLHLIDLAGSERVSKTDATGERLKEAQNINRSLSALGDVINALGKKSTHIPYRNSKLTFLLQDSLGGNSKVLMFVNISPAVYNVGESICSLGFAQRCRSVELGQAKKQSDSVVKKSSSSSNISTSTPSETAALSTSSSSKTSSSSTLRRPATSSSSIKK